MESCSSRFPCASKTAIWLSLFSPMVSLPVVGSLQRHAPKLTAIAFSGEPAEITLGLNVPSPTETLLRALSQPDPFDPAGNRRSRPAHGRRTRSLIALRFLLYHPERLYLMRELFCMPPALAVGSFAAAGSDAIAGVRFPRWYQMFLYLLGIPAIACNSSELSPFPALCPRSFPFCLLHSSAHAPRLAFAALDPLSSSPSATGQLRTDDAAQLGLFHRGRRPPLA